MDSIATGESDPTGSPHGKRAARSDQPRPHMETHDFLRGNMAPQRVGKTDLAA
jgi:hypothetical protein